VNRAQVRGVGLVQHGENVEALVPPRRDLLDDRVEIFLRGRRGIRMEQRESPRGVESLVLSSQHCNRASRRLDQVGVVVPEAIPAAHEFDDCCCRSMKKDEPEPPHAA